MTTSPSPSLPHQDPEVQTQVPHSTQHDDNQNHQQRNESRPQSPQTETLESPNPQESKLNQTPSQQQEAQKEDPLVINQKGDQLEKESGMSSRSPPTLIIPPINDQDISTLTSPTGLWGRPNKRKKGVSKKQKAIEQKVQTLIKNLKPIPFKPSKTLNFTKHEKFLKRLGLWDFVHIQFDREIRVDLIAQLIVNYEPRASYVHGFRVAVNRADLGRAFKLPVKKDKGSALASFSETLDLDSEAVVTEESIGFIEDFMSNWLLLHEDAWILPNEVVNWTKAIKDGHPEKVDWAGLVWFMVEKELNQGKQLKECYYASHLQYLIRSQREELFREENRVEVGAEVKEEEDGGEVEMWQESKVDAEVEVKEEDDGSEVKMGQDTEVEAVVEVKKDEDGGEIKKGKEPEVEEGMKMNEGEEEGDKVKMGKEPMVEAGGEMEEEEEDGGKLKMGKEPMLEVGMDVKDENDGEIVTGKEPLLEVGMDVKEENDGGIVTGKELMLEVRMDVKEKQDGGEIAMWNEPLLEVGMDLKEERDSGEIAMGKEPTVEAMVDVKEEHDGGEIAMGKEPGVEAMLNVKEEGADSELKIGEEHKVEPGLKVKGEEDIEVDMRMDGFDDFQVQESEDNVMVEEPNVELTLGKEVVEMDEEDEEVKEGDMMNIEEGEDERGQWLLDGKNNMGDHFLQRCKLETNSCMYGHQDEEEEEVDDEAQEDDDEFNLMSRGNTLDSGVLTGNLLPGMETTQMSFGLVETHGITGGPSIFSNGSKREIGHEDDMLHKRLKTDGAMSHKSFYFETCMGKMQHWMGKAMMEYQAKAHAFEESNMSQQFLLGELQHRENVIEHLQKTKHEEILKKDGEIYKLERELCLMGSLIEGYRKSASETLKAFSEYRQQCQLPEEPLYKDAGPGGLVLSTMELEKQRLKREEEERMIRSVIEQMVKEFQEEVSSKIGGKMEVHFNEVLKLDKRLMNFENEFKLLKELSAKPKASVTSECAPLD